MFHPNPDHIKPIAYFITEDFNADHVQELVQALDRSSIPYILQKEADTLGQTLDKRYFVIVDNIKGQVVLGPQFSSLLMFIVGYPRKGSNKKNHYCKKPQDVIIKYKCFCSLPSLQKTTFKTSLIKSKSQLKTIKSIPRSRQSSTILHQRSQSVSQKSIQPSIKQKSFAEINEKGKIFMLKVKDEGEQQVLIQYNMCINKVAGMNPIKCKIVQNLQELIYLLRVQPSKHNQLIINERNQKDLEDQNNKQMENLNIMVYKQAHNHYIKNRPNIYTPNNYIISNLHTKYCNSLEDIFQYVHALGNQPKPENLPTNNQVSILKTEPDKKAQKSRGRKIIWAKTQSEKQSSEKIQVPIHDQIIYINSQNQIGQFIPRLQNSKNISFTQQSINLKKRRPSQQQDIQTLISQPIKIKKQEGKKATFSNLIPKIIINQVPIMRIEAQNIKKQEPILNNQGRYQKTFRVVSTSAVNNPVINYINKQKGTETPSSSGQKKMIIRKIKRIKSDYNKSINASSSQNQEMYSQNMKTLANNCQYGKKITKRRMITPLIPQQYCSPISPASQSSIFQQQRVKTNTVIKRTIRCRSQQPEIRYMNQNQINDTYNQKSNVIKRIVKISPLNDGSQRSIHENSQTLYKFPQNTTLFTKKQDIFQSTTSTQNDYHLFFPTKHTNSPEQLFNTPHQPPIYSTSPYDFGTFGYFTKHCQYKDDNTSIVKQNLSKPSLKYRKNSYNKILPISPERESKMSIASQTVTFCSLKKTQKQAINNIKTEKNKRSRKKLGKPACILWKQFNYQIKQQIEHLEDAINCSNIRSYSFYLLQQFDKIIKCLPHLCKIIILMDDMEVEKYIRYIGQIVRKFDTLQIGQNKHQIVSLYIYPKAKQNLQRMKSLRRPDIIQNFEISEQLKKRMKIILSNDYYNNKSEISEQILYCLLGKNEDSGIQQSNSFTTNSID